MTPPITEPIVQINANLKALLGTAKVKPAKKGSTGRGKMIDSIIEINPKILSAKGLTALTLAFLINPFIVFL